MKMGSRSEESDMATSESRSELGKGKSFACFPF